VPVPPPLRLTAGAWPQALICTVTARRLKPGTADGFVEAFKQELPAKVKERLARVYVCRDVMDENSILTFAFFNGTLHELRELRSQYDQAYEVLAEIAF
jgi:hypothetical protein